MHKILFLGSQSFSKYALLMNSSHLLTFVLYWNQNYIDNMPLWSPLGNYYLASSKSWQDLDSKY